MKTMRWIGLAAVALSLLLASDAQAQSRSSGARTPCPPGRGLSRYNPATYGRGGLVDTLPPGYWEGGLVLTIIGTPPPAPDFAIESIVISPVAPSNWVADADCGPAPGEPFTAVVTVREMGRAPGTFNRLALWMNKPGDAATGEAGDISTNGPLWGYVGQTWQLSFALVAPTAPGSYVLRAFVDADGTTADPCPGNNQAALSYRVVGPMPDFVVTGVSFSPTPLHDHEFFTAYVTVKNQGDGPGDAGYLETWAARPPSAGTAAPATAPGAWARVGALDAGVSTNLVLTGFAGSAAGAYEFLAIMDSRTNTVERDESNNAFVKAYRVAPAVASRVFPPPRSIHSVGR